MRLPALAKHTPSPIDSGEGVVRLYGGLDVIGLYSLIPPHARNAIITNLGECEVDAGTESPKECVALQEFVHLEEIKLNYKE